MAVMHAMLRLCIVFLTVGVPAAVCKSAAAMKITHAAFSGSSLPRLRSLSVSSSSSSTSEGTEPSILDLLESARSREDKPKSKQWHLTHWKGQSVTQGNGYYVNLSLSQQPDALPFFVSLSSNVSVIDCQHPTEAASLTSYSPIPCPAAARWCIDCQDSSSSSCSFLDGLRDLPEAFSITSSSSTSAGYFIDEKIFVADDVKGKGSYLNITMGCQPSFAPDEETANFRYGLLGLWSSVKTPRPVSLLRKMEDEGHIATAAFALCLYPGGGSLILGSTNQEKTSSPFSYVNLVDVQQAPFTFILSEVYVGESEGLLGANPISMELSLASRINILPSALCHKVMTAFKKECQDTPTCQQAARKADVKEVCESEGKMQCFDGTGIVSAREAASILDLPSVTFELGNIIFALDLVLYREEGGDFCLPLTGSTERERAVLGTTSYENQLVTIDSRKHRIGFADVDCDGTILGVSRDIPLTLGVLRSVVIKGTDSEEGGGWAYFSWKIPQDVGDKEVRVDVGPFEGDPSLYASFSVARSNASTSSFISKSRGSEHLVLNTGEHSVLYLSVYAPGHCDFDIVITEVEKPLMIAVDRPFSFQLPRKSSRLFTFPKGSRGVKNYTLSVFPRSSASSFAVSVSSFRREGNLSLSLWEGKTGFDQLLEYSIDQALVGQEDGDLRVEIKAIRDSSVTLLLSSLHPLISLQHNEAIWRTLHKGQKDYYKVLVSSDEADLILRLHIEKGEASLYVACDYDPRPHRLNAPSSKNYDWELGHQNGGRGGYVTIAHSDPKACYYEEDNAVYYIAVEAQQTTTYRLQSQLSTGRTVSLHDGIEERGTVHWGERGEGGQYKWYTFQPANGADKEISITVRALYGDVEIFVIKEKGDESSADPCFCRPQGPYGYDGYLPGCSRGMIRDNEEVEQDNGVCFAVGGERCSRADGKRSTLFPGNKEIPCDINDLEQELPTEHFFTWSSRSGTRARGRVVIPASSNSSPTGKKEESEGPEENAPVYVIAVKNLAEHSKSTFSLLASSAGSAILLVPGVLSPQHHVPKGGTIHFYFPFPEDVGGLTLSVTPLSGDPDLFLSYGPSDSSHLPLCYFADETVRLETGLRAHCSEFDWRSTKGAGQLERIQLLTEDPCLTAVNAPNSRRCDASEVRNSYLVASVFGYKDSIFNILMATHGQHVHLVDGSVLSLQTTAEVFCKERQAETGRCGPDVKEWKVYQASFFEMQFPSGAEGAEYLLSFTPHTISTAGLTVFGSVCSSKNCTMADHYPNNEHYSLVLNLSSEGSSSSSLQFSTHDGSLGNCSLSSGDCFVYLTVVDLTEEKENGGRSSEFSVALSSTAGYQIISESCVKNAAFPCSLGRYRESPYASTKFELFLGGAEEQENDRTVGGDIGGKEEEGAQEDIIVFAEPCLGSVDLYACALNASHCSDPRNPSSAKGSHDYKALGDRKRGILPVLFLPDAIDIFYITVENTQSEESEFLLHALTSKTPVLAPTKEEILAEPLSPTTLRVSWSPAHLTSKKDNQSQSSAVRYKVFYGEDAKVPAHTVFHTSCGLEIATTSRSDTGVRYKSTDRDETSLILMDLHPATIYRINVLAYTLGTQRRQNATYIPIAVTTLPAGEEHGVSNKEKSTDKDVAPTTATLLAQKESSMSEIEVKKEEVFTTSPSPSQIRGEALFNEQEEDLEVSNMGLFLALTLLVMLALFAFSYSSRRRRARPSLDLRRAARSGPSVSRPTSESEAEAEEESDEHALLGRSRGRK